MSLDLPQPCHSWTHSTGGRGKRRHEVRVGCYVLQHAATGRFIAGFDSKVSTAVDKELEKLKAGKHKSKLFSKLYSLDDEINVYEAPTKKLEQAKAVIQKLRKTATPTYLSVG